MNSAIGFLDESFGAATQAEPAESRKRTVLLVDDHPVVREGLREFINREADFEVCATAETGADAMAAIARFNPSVVVLDMELPNCHGLELLQDIHAQYPNLPVLIFSMHEESVYAQRALRGGARGYLMKLEPPRRLLEGMRTIINGGYFLSSEASSHVLSALASPHSVEESPVASLGNRELEVFQFIGQRKGTREIAGTLCLSVKTVETYRERIKQKLNVRSSTELTRQAVCWVENGR
ncbi:MAG TPA: response regulator transcription factor [Verrucomicrobiae bacterium]|nr:response regulator transcription factor [Verrucomicrobiae bacterium]